MAALSSYPLEGLLRISWEWYSALGYALGLLLLFVLWKALVFPLWLLFVFVGLLLGLMAYRLWQGFKPWHYQRYLKKLPFYRISSTDIPTVPGRLFLGRGFAWQPKHVQRLFDCYQSLTEADRPSTPVGGLSFLHGVESQEKVISMPLSDRVAHTLVLGTTRVGKTRLLELLVAQDIRRGDVTLVFDPKGDKALLQRMYLEAQQAGRLDDLIIFHLGFPESSWRYNPIGQFARVTEGANRLTGQLPASGDSQAFKDFAWQFINMVAKALIALGCKPRYETIGRYLVNVEPLLIDYLSHVLPDKHWQQQVEAIKAGLKDDDIPHHLRGRPHGVVALLNYLSVLAFDDAIANDLVRMCSYDKTYFDKITASVLPLLQKLGSGEIAALISPDYEDLNDKRPLFDWLQVIRQRRIVYVGLDALSDSEVAGAVGNAMLADLCSLAGQLYKFGRHAHLPALDETPPEYPINIHADEFNELCGTEFIPLLNKAGGAQFQVTAYTQTWSDVEAKLQDKAKAAQVGGNLNTLICLRVLEESTARLVTDKLNQRVTRYQKIESSSGQSGSQNDEKFSVSNEDRLQATDVPLLSPHDLLQLPKGQAFCLLEGGQLYKVRFPLPCDDFSEVPETVAEMVQPLWDNAGSVAYAI